MSFERWLALMALLFVGCLDDGRVKIPYNDVPRDLGDGWAIASPESEDFDPDRLRKVYERFFSENEYVTATGLLVIRNGVLVAEGYCRDLGDIHKKQALMSATKSVTSLLTGMMIDRSLLRIDDTLGDLLPRASTVGARKKSIAVEDLLTMRSGLHYSDDTFSLDMAHGSGGNRIRHILSKPLIHEPGTTFNYQDCDPHLLSASLSSAAGIHLSRFADEHLFRPLGIEDTVWLADRDGLTYGAYGLYLKARDLAKIGQMVLQGGVWNGETIVSLRGWRHPPPLSSIPPWTISDSLTNGGRLRDMAAISRGGTEASTSS